MLLLFYYWFHWSLTNSGCLCYWQEPSPFIWYCVPLLWYLLHSGSLKLKGELWKRFSIPSDKIFLFFLFSPFWLEEANFCDSNFVMILQILCDVDVYIFCLCIKTAFSVSCVSTNSCILGSTVSSFFFFNSFISIFQENNIHLHILIEIKGPNPNAT